MASRGVSMDATLTQLIQEIINLTAKVQALEAIVAEREKKNVS